MGSSGSEVNGGCARGEDETEASSVDIEATRGSFVIRCKFVSGRNKLQFVFRGSFGAPTRSSTSFTNTSNVMRLLSSVGPKVRVRY